MPPLTLVNKVGNLQIAIIASMVIISIVESIHPTSDMLIPLVLSNSIALASYRIIKDSLHDTFKKVYVYRFFSFILFGSLPISPYMLNVSHPFILSLIISGLLIGLIRIAKEKNMTADSSLSVIRHIIVALCISTIAYTVSLLYQISQTSPHKMVSLPALSNVSDTSFLSLLKTRRSVREYSQIPLNLMQVTQLLWAAQGVSDNISLRTAPSAGGLYPLNLYLVVNNVKTLRPGIYQYNIQQQTLSFLKAGNYINELIVATSNQQWMKQASAHIVITGTIQMTKKKYPIHAKKNVMIEVGAVAENIYLQAAASEIGTTLVGAIDVNKLKPILNLPQDETPFAVMPIERSV